MRWGRERAGRGREGGRHLVSAAAGEGVHGGVTGGHRLGEGPVTMATRCLHRRNEETEIHRMRPNNTVFW